MLEGAKPPIVSLVHRIEPVRDAVREQIRTVVVAKAAQRIPQVNGFAWQPLALDVELDTALLGIMLEQLETECVKRGGERHLRRPTDRSPRATLPSDTR